MQIQCSYMAQVKTRAGCGSETVDIPDDSTVQDLIHTIAKAHGAALCTILLDDQNQLRKHILIFLGDEQIRWNDNTVLCNNATITIMSPIAGG